MAWTGSLLLRLAARAGLPDSLPKATEHSTGGAHCPSLSWQLPGIGKICRGTSLRRMKRPHRLLGDNRRGLTTAVGLPVGQPAMHSVAVVLYLMQPARPRA